MKIKKILNNTILIILLFAFTLTFTCYANNCLAPKTKVILKVEWKKIHSSQLTFKPIDTNPFVNDFQRLRYLGYQRSRFVEYNGKVYFAKSTGYESKIFSYIEKILFLLRSINFPTFEKYWFDKFYKYFFEKKIDLNTDEPRKILHEALIHSVLEDSQIQNISRASHFLELENNQKIILFEAFPSGKTLAEKVLSRSQRYTEQEAIDLVIYLAEIVKKYDKYGIINRDISPCNIWISDKGPNLLYDFGNAFLYDEFGNVLRPNKTIESQNFFCNFASKTPSIKDDIFSLGMTLAYVLIGYSKIRSCLSTFAKGDYEEYKILNPNRILNEELTKPEYNNLSKGILDVLEKTICDGKSEYKDVSDFIDALNRVKQKASLNKVYDFKLDFSKINELKKTKLLKSQQKKYLKLAVNYFNENILKSSQFSWEHFVDLYAIIKGDIDNPNYTKEIRSKRINSLSQVQQELMVRSKFYRNNYNEIVNMVEILNTKFEFSYDAIDTAIYLYTFITEEQLFWHLPGFDIDLHQKSVEDVSSDGHHRFSWFLLNYILINNGVKPYYFSKEIEIMNDSERDLNDVDLSDRNRNMKQNIQLMISS